MARSLSDKARDALVNRMMEGLEKVMKGQDPPFDPGANPIDVMRQLAGDEADFDEESMNAIRAELEKQTGVDPRFLKKGLGKAEVYRRMYGGAPDPIIDEQMRKEYEQEYKLRMSMRYDRGYDERTHTYFQAPAEHHPYEDLVADISREIEIHEDVYEFLEVTEHTVRISLERDPGWCRIDYMKSVMDAAEFMWRREHESMYEARYKEEAIYTNHIKRSDLLVEPEKACEIIQATVDQNRGEYDPNPMRDVAYDSKLFGMSPRNVVTDDPFKKGSKPAPTDLSLSYLTCETCGWNETFESYYQRRFRAGHCNRCGHFLHNKHPHPEWEQK